MSVTVTPNTVEKTVTDALCQFGIDPDQITPEATFDQLDLDSLDLAELAQVIEEEHGVRLTGSDVTSIKSVGDAVELVVSRAA
jgi:acyl carrier protein